MKKLITCLLLFLLTCSACLAEIPQDPTLYDATSILGMDTHYYLYDREFYEQEDAQPGTVVKLKYTTKVYEKEYKKNIAVYLPYGYEENGTQRYPVVYFFHGRGCDVMTLLGHPGTKNALDHMISSGDVQPFILVAPTYYYDVRKNLVDMDKFVLEFRTEILPMIEGQYRTYALTPDEAGFQASRDQRAISGFSMGSMTTWSLFDDMLDVCANFLPFSGGTDAAAIQAAADATDLDFFIYMACGGVEDDAFEGCNALAKELAADTARFSYGTDQGKNNFYYYLSDNIHQDLTSRYYLYNAFRDGLFR